MFAAVAGKHGLLIVLPWRSLFFLRHAGKNEVVRFLLKSGANPSTVNNLGKTASTMAAFVGQYAWSVGMVSMHAGSQ